MFDKESRHLKRKWKREQVLKLEALNTSDPIEFWETVKNMGRKSKKNIPEEVYMSDGSISNDLYDILNRWETDFGSLFDKSDRDIEAQLFLDHITRLNRTMEDNMNHGPHYEFDN